MGYPYSERREMQLYVTMEPCMMCLGAATSFYISEIYYAHESPIDGAVKFAKEYWRPNNKEIPNYKLPKCSLIFLKDISVKTYPNIFWNLSKEGAYEFWLD